MQTTKVNDLNNKKDTLPPWFICLTLAIVTLAAYYGVWNHGFLGFDDLTYIKGNDHVRPGLTVDGIAWAFQTSELGHWHPLTWISHMAVAGAFSPDRAAAHIVVNLLLHIASVLVLYLTLFAATGREGRSFVVAALFALHPMHVESVAWIAERKDVLSGLFWMLTMYAYVRYAKKPGAGRYVLIALFLTIGLLAKAILVTLPLCMLLLDFWPLRRIRGLGGDQPFGKLVVEKLPLFGIVGAVSWVAVVMYRDAVVNMVGTFSFAGRASNALVSYSVYLKQSFWPTGLALFYPYPEEPMVGVAALSAGLLLVISVAALWFARRLPYLFVGWFWFVGTLVPVIGLAVQTGEQAHADRFTYLPHIGLFVALVWGIADAVGRLRHGKRILQAATAIVLLMFANLAMLHQRTFRNTLAVFQHALEVTERNHVAHHFVGLELARLGRIEEATEHWRAAVRANPHYAPSHVNLGLELARKGQNLGAIQHFETALEREPGQVTAHFNLANNRYAVGDAAAAVEHWRLTLEYDPDHSDAGLRLAWTLATDPDDSLRDGAEAVELAERFLRGNDPPTLHQRDLTAAAYAEAGRFDDALATIDEALRLAESANQPKAVRILRSRRGRYEDGNPLRAPRTEGSTAP